MDYTQYWLVYETDKGDFEIIDGNQRKILLQEYGIEVWPCRWIPKQAVSNIFFYYETLYGAFFDYFSILPSLKFENWGNSQMIIMIQDQFMQLILRNFVTLKMYCQLIKMEK